jgi:hypothetical protein
VEITAEKSTLFVLRHRLLPCKFAHALSAMMLAEGVLGHGVLGEERLPFLAGFQIVECNTVEDGEVIEQSLNSLNIFGLLQDGLELLDPL